MSRAILPGSYDPITLGHLDIVKRAAAHYDEVVVAVMNNDAKTYMFPMAERTRMVTLATAELPRVRVVSSEGLLIDLFDREEADVIVKGVRNCADRAYEEKMAAWNLEHNPRAKTVFMQAADDFETVSSTVVREALLKGEWPAGLLPAPVLTYLRDQKNAAK
ncbi:MAG: pantetheine-phosphate adenylyltransferase [Clostridia bacterium]|nr:pantetheine-phosphate adenylyltransferase [Clostridia bacterium]